MKISLIAPLAALLLIASPALAKNTTIAPAKEVCVSPDKTKAGLKDSKLEADLSGDALAKFNEAYSKATKAPAPTIFDRLLIVSNPKVPFFVLLAFKDGCAVGLQVVDPPTVKKYLNADDGSI